MCEKVKLPRSLKCVLEFGGYSRNCKTSIYKLPFYCLVIGKRHLGEKEMRGFDIGFEKHVKWGFQYISRFSFLF